MHILVGNHDTFYKNTNEINSQSELLNQYGNIHSYENAQDITIDDLNIALEPNDIRTKAYTWFCFIVLLCIIQKTKRDVK